MLRPTPESFDERSGLLLVAAVHGEDSPNYDGLCWFLAEVWPLLRQHLPGIELHVAGYWKPEIRRPAGAGECVRWHGAVGDLTPLYSAARLFVAPVRYGAGLPLKILDAASRGLPVCTTTAMGDLLGWTHEQELVATDADQPAEFAEAIARAYVDSELWSTLRAKGLERIRSDHSSVSFASSIREALSIVTEAREVGAPGQSLRMPGP